MKDFIADDEACLQLQELTLVNEAGLVLKQGEAVTTVVLEDLYDNEKYRNRLALFQRPPKLVIINDDGIEFELTLSRDFNYELLRMLKEVDNAFCGGRRTTRQTLRDVILYFKKTPLKDVILQTPWRWAKVAIGIFILAIIIISIVLTKLP